MANQLIYGDYTFSDDDILRGTLHAEQALIAETLGADTAEFVVRSQTDLTAFTYGTELDYWNDGNLIGVFYLSEVRKTAVAQYRLKCVSAVGLLVKMTHKGGVYFNTRVQILIDAIMAETQISYEIETAVANSVLSGFLPYASKRDNLQQVLFACGASLFKRADGSLLFTYNQPDIASYIPDERVYMGGSVNYTTPATKINVTEHLYYQSPTTEKKELYAHTGSAADHEELIWDNPTYGLTSDAGITIHESGANYVIFSGIGKIYGYEYVHIQSMKSEATGIEGDANEISIRNATMVSALNSANVLARAKKYYSISHEIEYNIVLGAERTGDLVAVRDPYGSEAVSGYIKDMDISVSKTLKSKTTIVTGWTPTDVGNNFDAYELVTTSGTWTPPSDYAGGAVRVVVVGGATGGGGGTAGSAGTINSSYKYTAMNAQYTGYNSDSTGGAGGKGAKGGVGLMVNSVDLASLASSYAVTIGAGGAGGTNGAAGTIGGATAFGSYSSASGSLVSSGFINFISGDVYGLPGADGVDGGAGGDFGASGGSVMYNGQARSGGGSRGKYQPNPNYNLTYYSGGGGGAAGGTPYTTPGWGDFNGGRGGYATAMAQASIGQCGAGGNGGGGGGGGGHSYGPGWGSDKNGAAGSGGAGQAGQKGGNGFVIVYYLRAA